MIKAKVQLFDDASGNDIGKQKIVLPEACYFYFLPNKEPTAEFDFRFSTEDPASLFDGLDLNDQEWSIIKAFKNSR